MSGTPEMKSRGYAMVLIPDEAALTQDLGPFRRDLLGETKILPYSAVVCLLDDEGRLQQRDGMLRVAFEGNAGDSACNLMSFHERMVCAAGRLVTNYGSIAYGLMHPDHVQIAAKLDLDRMILEEIYEPRLLSHWAGEPIEEIFPTPAPDGSNQKEDLDRLLKRGLGDTLHCPPMVFQFRNGQIYAQGERWVTGAIYNHDNPELRRFFETHNIQDMSVRIRALGFEGARGLGEESSTSPDEDDPQP